jgi:2'-5' RNA ligase
MSGRHLQKSPDSLCVVNIIPPRELWEVIQPLRNKYTANARCGPHITFIDPFVLSHEYTEARQILEDAFASLEPFEVRFEKFNFFKHKSSSTLFLEPIAPEGAFDRLIELAAQAFPQCRDQLDRGNGKWVPHLSIGNFKDHNELVKVMTELQNNWKPLRFTLKEVYLLNRYDPKLEKFRAPAIFLVCVLTEV